MHCPHCHSPIGVAAISPPPIADVRILSSKSTETEAQELRILAALRTGPKTTDDLRRLGIYQASARVFGLRKRGHIIQTDLFNGYAADGYTHARMARYTLIEEASPLDDATPLQATHKGAGAQDGGEAMCS